MEPNSTILTLDGKKIKLNEDEVVVILTPDGNCSLPLLEILKVIKQFNLDGLGVSYRG